jgi:glycosyltransferase involved in cell wall biosynthesis
MNKKRVLLIGDAGSVHLERWASGMHARGFTIALFSLRAPANPGEYSKNNITVFLPGFSFQADTFWSSLVSKIAYIRALPALKRAIRVFKPDVIHAHYASSYGLLGALSGFHPFCISVWGSDVLAFPEINSLTARILRHNLAKADRILVTSHELFRATQKFTRKNPEIIPFGIDPSLYESADHSAGKPLTFGSAKALTPVYGHDIALKAFALIHDQLPQESRFLIAGSGRDESELKALCVDLGISEKTFFSGHLNKESIPAFLSKLDVLVNLSRSESFGVIVLEAAASEVPAIVSDTGGLKEVVRDRETGILVKSENTAEAAEAMLLLATNRELRLKMGSAARKFACEQYNWTDSLEKMSTVYFSLLNQNL